MKKIANDNWPIKGVFVVWLFLIVPNAATAFEICQKENSYLEAALTAHWFSSMNDPDSLSVPVECIEAANLSLAPKGYYGFCPTPQGKPGRTHPRPCVSEKYVRTTHQALNDVADCLDYNPRWAFSILNLESALHMNAVGAGSDAGIGQLTESAIREVNLNALPRAQRRMASSQRPSCQRILPLATEGPSAPDKRCEFVHVPTNPTRNLIYAVLLLQRNRQIVDNFIRNLDIQIPAKVNGERLKTLLSILAYNSGVGGLASSLKAYINRMGSNIDDRYFDFEDRSPKSFVTYLQKNFPSRDEVTRRRVSRYLGFIMASARRIERPFGEGHCTQPELFHVPVRIFDQSGDTPDDLQIVYDYQTELAQAWLQEKVSLHARQKTNCEQRQSEFIYSFAVRGQTLTDLPPDLQTVYRGICLD